MVRTLNRRSLLRGVAALGVGPALSACTPRTWKNAGGNMQVTPQERAFPSSARALIELVQGAEARGARVRMTGSGHSFSDVAVTDEVLLGPSCLDDVLPIDGAQLRTDVPAKAGRALVRVQSGTTIRQLNQRLWASGRSLQNLGGYDGQTIVGAAITGTHGSGLDHGPIVSQVVSLQVVTTGGELLQVEPTSGVTDPARFVDHLPEDPSVRIRLVQDDDVFNAVSVSLGCMGIVYAVVLEVETRFWLRERRTLTTLEALSAPGGFLHELLRTGRAPARKGEPAPDHYEIYFSPYASRKSGRLEHSAILTERLKLRAEPSRDTNARRRGRGVDAGSILALVADRLGVVESQLNRDSEVGVKLIETSLKTLRDDRFIDRGYRVYHLGAANYARALGIEMAFDLGQTLDATHELLATAARERWLDRTHAIPVTLRFVKQTPALLAMQHGRPTMMMEIGMFSAVSYAQSMLVEYEHAFMSRFSARPHWGLDLDVIRDTHAIAALYPEWAKWRRVYQTLNPHGTFDGAFTDRIGLSQPRSS